MRAELRPEQALRAVRSAQAICAWAELSLLYASQDAGWLASKTFLPRNQVSTTLVVPI